MSERVWKKPSEGGEINFIRPSKLTEDDVGTALVEGVFLESVANHYDDTKRDFKFEREDGSKVIINQAGNLGYRMKAVNPGDFVQITYEGKQEIQNGKMKGRSAHNFSVLVAEE